MNFKCPHCHEPGITFFWKWRSSKKYPASCVQCGKASHGIGWWVLLYWELTSCILIAVTVISPLFSRWWSFIAVTIVAFFFIESIRVISFPMVPLKNKKIDKEV